MVMTVPQNLLMDEYGARVYDFRERYNKLLAKRRQLLREDMTMKSDAQVSVWNHELDLLDMLIHMAQTIKKRISAAERMYAAVARITPAIDRIQLPVVRATIAGMEVWNQTVDRFQQIETQNPVIAAMLGALVTEALA
jgi:recombinational DNA repair ATPase RecF